MPQLVPISQMVASDSDKSGLGEVWETGGYATPCAWVWPAVMSGGGGSLGDNPPLGWGEMVVPRVGMDKGGGHFTAPDMLNMHQDRNVLVQLILTTLPKGEH